MQGAVVVQNHHQNPNLKQESVQQKEIIKEKEKEKEKK